MLSPTIINRLAILGGLIPTQEGGFVPLSPHDVAEVESRFGNALPADYEAFVFEYGRGMFTNLVRRNIMPGRFVYLGTFIGGGRDENEPSHIHWALKMLCYRMPPTLLPIVDTAGGEGHVCLGMGGAEYGRIYFWDRAEGWEGEADDYRRQGKVFPEELKFQNVTLIADTFEQFIHGLIAIEE